MTEALKPCPFCGGEAQVEFFACWVVECQDCAASTAGRDTEANAVSDWNTRHVPVPEEVREADVRIGVWLSAALEDPKVCDKMKADINNWFEKSNS